MPATKHDEYKRSEAALADLGLEVDLMRPLTPFALRMPHEVKEAVRAISKARFYEWREDGKTTLRGWGGGSINDVLNDLLRQGLKHCRPLIEAEVTAKKAERLPYARMAAYLISEPEAEGVRASDFPDDKEVAELLAGIHAEIERDAETEWKWTYDRAELMFILSGFDRELQELTTALKAVDAALAG